jgi:carboxypeptidase family protein
MRTLAVVACIVGAPSLAFARAAITGLVEDPSGAAVAGVLVEASSPALIEKTRTAITDSAGRYRIEALPPGTYRVTFTRQGWAPYRQEGVELSGSFTATVNAAFTVGAFTETVQVAREAPAVDAHSATREVTLTGDTVKSIPTVRSYNALLVLVPGIVTTTNDTVTGTATTNFPIHGGRTSEGRLLLDGLNIGSPPTGNSATSYVVDLGEAQEVTFTTSSAAGEVETSGLVMNIVPKSGGNTVRGSFFASGTGSKLQSDNLTRALREQGVRAATPLTRVYDISGTFGGPIRKDRAWYFLNGHIGGSTKESANVYYNLNAGDRTRWLYAPDLSRPEYSDRTFENASARITWQIAARHKVGGFWDAQVLCRTCGGATPGLSEPASVSPEAVGVLGRPLHVSQATWSSPMTNRWLLEASFGGTYFGVGNFERQPNPTRDLIRVVEQCGGGCAANGNIPGLVYRSQDFSVAHTGSYLWKGAVSYVTGTHSLKIGYQHTLMTDDRTWMTNTQNLTYTFNSGEPSRLTQSISPWVNDARAGWDALFVQEHWTHDRMTLQGAVRFDRAVSWFPAQQEGPSRFLPTPIVIPEARGVDSYKDITPRVGIAYDVLGTGTTAIKVSVGKYLEGAGVSGNYANANPTLRMPRTTAAFGTAGVTRAWTDTNRNFVPDCDLLNPAAQDLRPDGGDLCGVVSNTSFGQNTLTNAFDPDILNGWGVRPSDWNLSVSLQQQIGPRSSAAVTYIRRWFHGFSVADNLSVLPSDFTPFSIVAPSDPRLPGGGGYMISGLFDVVPEKAGQVSNLIANAGDYGNWWQRYEGLDLTFGVRVGEGFTFVGGTSTGRTVADSCEVRAQLPEFATTTTGTSTFGAGLMGSAVTPVSPYCHVSSGVLPQLRGLSSYIIPRAGVQLSATFQSKPGAMVAADYAVPNAAVLPSLGRDLSGNAPNVTVNLVPPGTQYGDRVNQLDLRVAKTFAFGRSRTRIAFDIYNALNSSAVLSFDSTFILGGPWLRPTSILTPRFLRITAELDF